MNSLTLATLTFIFSRLFAFVICGCCKPIVTCVILSSYYGPSRKCIRQIPGQTPLLFHIFCGSNTAEMCLWPSASQCRCHDTQRCSLKCCEWMADIRRSKLQSLMWTLIQSNVIWRAQVNPLRAHLREHYEQIRSWFWFQCAMRIISWSWKNSWKFQDLLSTIFTSYSTRAVVCQYPSLRDISHLQPLSHHILHIHLHLYTALIQRNRRLLLASTNSLYNF